MKRICFLVADSPYDVKRSWTFDFSKALNRQGYTTSIVDIGDHPLDRPQIDQILALRPELICSFFPIEPIEGHTLLCDLLKIPNLTLLTEPAIYSLYLAKSPYSLVGCVDYFDCELFYNAKIDDRVFFFPHAISTQKLLEPAPEKIFDVVFIGSCYDPEAIRNSWEQNFSPEIVTVIEHAISLTLTDDHTAFTQALVEAWRESELDPEGRDFEALCREVDLYIRAVGRLELLKAIKGVNVHVFGNTDGLVSHSSRGWDDLLKGKANIQTYPGITADEAWKVVQQAKVCLNSSPWFKHGTHERIVLGLAARSLVFSDANRFLEAHFGEERGVIPYVLGGWEYVNERLHYYLERENEREAIVERGLKTIALEYSWDVRAEEFTERVPALWNGIAAENFIRTF